MEDRRVLMVLTSDGADGARALESGAMVVVGEEDFMQPELAVLQSPLAIANGKRYVSRGAHAHMREPELMVESPQSLTPREQEILVLLLKGLSDVAIADALGLSIHAVKDDGKSIRAQYNVKSCIQLISPLLGRAMQKAR